MGDIDWLPRDFNEGMLARCVVQEMGLSVIKDGYYSYMPIPRHEASADNPKFIFATEMYPGEEKKFEYQMFELTKDMSVDNAAYIFNLKFLFFAEWDPSERCFRLREDD